MQDKVVLCRMYNPHDHDFHHQRDDGSIYVIEIRKGKDNYCYDLEHQIEFQFNEKEMEL